MNAEDIIFKYFSEQVDANMARWSVKSLPRSRAATKELRQQQLIKATIDSIATR